MGIWECVLALLVAFHVVFWCWAGFCWLQNEATKAERASKVRRWRMKLARQEKLARKLARQQGYCIG